MPDWTFLPFDRDAAGQYAVAPEPRVTLTPTGQLRLNAAAYALLGSPPYLQFGIEPTGTAVLSLRAASAATPGRAKVTPGKRPTHAVTVSAQAVLRRLGAWPRAARHYQPRRWREWLVLDLATPEED